METIVMESLLGNSEIAALISELGLEVLMGEE